jgi:hypothetical protein
MEKRITKRDNFEALRTIVDDALTFTDAESFDRDLRERLLGFIDHEVELLDRKHGSGKLTASQRENIALKQEIVRVLNSGEKFRSGDVASELGITIQKSTALLNQIVNETESVVKVKEGKVTYFTTVE